MKWNVGDLGVECRVVILFGHVLYLFGVDFSVDLAVLYSVEWLVLDIKLVDALAN